MFFNRKQETRADTWETLFNQGEEPTLSNVLQETTIHRCIDYISKSIGKCSVEIKQNTEVGEVKNTAHKWYETLNLRHNPYMSAIDSINTLVVLGELYGQSGLYIDRKNKYLYPVRINTITIDDAGLIQSTKNNKILYDVQVGDYQFSCFESDLIIYKSGISLDGIKCKSNTSYMSQTITTAKNAQTYLSDTFSSGGINKLIVQMTSDIKDEKEINKIQDKFQRLYSAKGRVLTIPAGFHVSNLNMSLADSQFAEIRKLTKQEICSVFGVPMSVVGDLSDSNNNSLEQGNLSFLIDTLLPKLMQLEAELDYKILSNAERKAGNKIRFNQGVMLRTDSEKQSVILQRYVQAGIFTINDARRILGQELIPNADEPILSSGSLKLSLIDRLSDQNKQTLEGGENDE